ncbi:hypothetical protein [Phenylobacterium sp.]|uniref:hypothetical protein n=1 Tax=Phenylobacterium sp. TaxID=1871053 RepID=UPI002ED8F587
MSDAAFDDDAMLARLAQRDLAAAERVHDKLMAAEDASDIADLGRTYQRLARSLRQTLALKARLQSQRADEADRTAIERRRAAALRERLTELRVTHLQNAVERVAAAAIPDYEVREERLDRFDVELDDWVDEPDFHTADLEGQVLRAARLLDLPEDLARAWRTLPKPPPPDPTDALPPDSADDPEVPWPNTG